MLDEEWQGGRNKSFFEERWEDGAKESEGVGIESGGGKRGEWHGRKGMRLARNNVARWMETRVDTSGREISSINFRLSPIRRCLARDILLP